MQCIRTPSRDTGLERRELGEVRERPKLYCLQLVRYTLVLVLGGMDGGGPLMPSSATRVSRPQWPQFLSPWIRN